jgi:hypothetical protein
MTAVNTSAWMPIPTSGMPPLQTLPLQQNRFHNQKNYYLPVAFGGEHKGIPMKNNRNRS